MFREYRFLIVPFLIVLLVGIVLFVMFLVKPKVFVSESFKAGVETGCLRALLREREYGVNVLTGADCEAILAEYEAWGQDKE